MSHVEDVEYEQDTTPAQRKRGGSFGSDDDDHHHSWGQRDDVEQRQGAVGKFGVVFQGRRESVVVVVVASERRLFRAFCATTW